MNRLRLPLSLAAVALLGAGAIAARAAEPASATSPVRVATLLPFVARALALAPERATVVGTVREDLRTPVDPSSGALDLGNPHSPSLEALAQASPQLVVVDAQMHAMLAPKLGASGAELVLVDSTTVASTLAALESLGARVGGGAELAEAVDATRARIASAKLAAPVDLLALFGSPGSFYAISDRMWLGDLARELGFHNIAPAGESERFPGLVPVSDEAISLLAPELVVIVAHGDPRAIEAELGRRTAPGSPWENLGRAARGIHVLDPRRFASNPGLGLADAAVDLAALAQSGAAVSAPPRAEGAR